jgi:hypothetical protein
MDINDFYIAATVQKQQFFKALQTHLKTPPLNIHRAGDARNQLFVAGNDQINVPARGHFVVTLQL